MDDIIGCVRTENKGIKKKGWALLARHLLELGQQQHGLQSFQLVAEHLTLVGKRNLLLHRRTDPTELAYFIEGATEARGRATLPNPRMG